MLEPAALLAFFLTALLLDASPGPNFAYVLTRSVGYGRGEGFALVLGICTGSVVHTLAAVFGLSALLASSAQLTGAVALLRFSGGPRVLSPATVQAKLAAARALYKALRWAGATSTSPFENVRAAKDPVPAWEKRGAYTPEEVEALLEVAAGPDKVMVPLGAHAGLRIAEMAALRWPDLDWRSKELVVRKGKGGKTARVAMTRRLRETLFALPRDTADLSGYVLPFRAYRARERFQKSCLLARVEYSGKEVHGLRHGAGTRTYTQFRNLGRVAQHLRQASVDTARRYAKMSDKVVGDGIEEW